MICPNCGENKVRRTNTTDIKSVRMAYAKCGSCGARYKTMTVLLPGDMPRTESDKLYQLLRGDHCIQLQIVSHVTQWAKSPHEDLVQMTLPLVTEKEGGSS